MPNGDVVNSALRSCFSPYGTFPPDRYVSWYFREILFTRLGAYFLVLVSTFVKI